VLVDSKVVAVAERVPAIRCGDGVSTIEQLLEKTNQDPNRGHDNVLTRIEVDRTSYQLLNDKAILFKPCYKERNFYLRQPQI